MQIGEEEETIIVVPGEQPRTIPKPEQVPVQEPVSVPS